LVISHELERVQVGHKLGFWQIMHGLD